MSVIEHVPPPPPVKIRLQKFLASCGLGSRRACEQFILDGRVTIDGRVANQLGVTVDPSRQQIALDGEPLTIERKQYFALNKPRGVVCTNRDPAGRPRVIDLFPAGGPRLFPIGRLDAESEGLILVTNDGDLAQKLAHPRYRIYRTYHVHVAGVPNRPALDRMKAGEHFAEGKFRVHSAKILKKQGDSSFLEVVLTEGQNREVRRLLARIGHKVMRLKRVAFGPIQLGRLSRGETRSLTMAELTELHTILDRNISGDGPSADGGTSPAAAHSHRPRRSRSGVAPEGQARSRSRGARGEPQPAEHAARRTGRHGVASIPAPGQRKRKGLAPKQVGIGHRPARTNGDETAAPGKPAHGEQARGRPAQGRPAQGRPARGKPAHGRPAKSFGGPRKPKRPRH